MNRKTKSVGVIGAMKAETDALKAALADPVTETISGVDFVSGRFGNVNLIVAQCGIGKVFAALCAQTMILRFHPDFVLNIGVGGSLSEQLNIADVGVARAVASPENSQENLAFLAQSPLPVEFLEQQSTPLFISLTPPATERSIAPFTTFPLDGLWITTRATPRRFSPPAGAARRLDLSWDPLPKGAEV